MRISVTALAVLGAVTVSAQAPAYPADMPECGKTCGDLIFTGASTYNCAPSDLKCLCGNKDFGYAIHDCSYQHCQNNTAADIAINWGNTLCANAGVPIDLPPATSSTGAGGAGSATGSTGTSGATSTGGAGGGAGVTSVAITTSSFTTVVTSGDQTITSTGATTLFSTGAAGGGGSSATGVTSSGASPTGSSGTSETSGASSTQSSGAANGSSTSRLGGGSQTSAGANPTTTSSTGGIGPQVTAGPMAGFLVAAGVAVAFL